jgi:hypothetical protein
MFKFIFSITDQIYIDVVTIIYSFFKEYGINA